MSPNAELVRNDFVEVDKEEEPEESVEYLDIDALEGVKEARMVLLLSAMKARASPA